MSNPENYKFTEDHEWVSEGDKARVGVSAHAVEQLGDIVHMELPKVGDKVTVGEAFGTIESTKTVSDLHAPCNGTVTSVNDGLVNDPESLSSDPYNKGWLVEVELESDLSTELMPSAKYEDYLKSQP